jgi:hypothetical protein
LIEPALPKTPGHHQLVVFHDGYREPGRRKAIKRGVNQV